MSELLEKLETYADSDYLPMHMPGHKRRMGDLGNPFFIDITEIDGFDDLHHAEGILKKAEERAAELYGSEETHYLVNGSTSGILSAISGCTAAGGTVLLARNSHKSAYHAVLLRGLHVHYLYPQPAGHLGINGPVTAEDVDNLLKSHPETQAVFITSPTYDGVVSDVEAIAEVVHRKKIPLIVDEAHGAHFPFSEQFPKDSVSCGADVVIHSVHKTLPSLTQTALIHLNGSLINREKIRYFLGVYQSSSPSYVLMAGIDQCMDWVASHRTAFDEFAGRLKGIRTELRKLQALELLEVPGMDLSKILLSGRRYGVTGNELSEMLRADCQIELEMACGEYACALTSVADRDEDLNRLLKACRELDQKLLRDRKPVIEKQYGTDTVLKTRHLGTILETFEQPSIRCEVKDAEGKVSSGFVIPYPPGIPLLVPGEEVTEAIRNRIQRYVTDGLTVYGCDHGTIKVTGKQEKETWEKYSV